MRYLQRTLFLACLIVSPVTWACLTAETENNNSRRGADSGLCSDILVEGSIGSNSDVDWFVFNTSAAEDITVSLNHHRRDDFDWRLENVDRQVIAIGDSSNRPETGGVSIAAAGKYYLRVNRYRGRGWYELSVSFAEGDGGGGADCGYGAAPAKPSSLQAPLVGNVSDACGNLIAGNGATLLMGGGADVDAAFSNRVRNHVGSGADVVVLRTSGSDAYNTYLQNLMNADSVITLIADSPAKANDAYTDWVIRSAEFVWIAGGDQSDYLNTWAGTSVQSALQHVYDKGGVIGGTSAGMAVLSDVIYDPDGILGAVSDEVVTDFCHNTINFSAGMVDIPVLSNTLNDTHFYERDRMGRLLVFMAHQSREIVGVAASEGTSIFVTSDGLGEVDGDHEVYVTSEIPSTELVQASCGQPVIYNNVSRVKLLSGDTYNFISGSHTGYDIDVSIDGRSNGFYAPSDPY